jgi:pullulanase/glycogen debranching enzyme
LQIRKSSPLFRLQTADEVERSLTFLNTGKSQVSGLIVMHLNNADNLDPNYNDILVLFNANKDALTFTDSGFNGQEYNLHPIQQNSVDPVVGTSVFDSATGSFTIPGRTTAVFVKNNPVQPTLQPAVESTVTPQPTADGSGGLSPLVIVGIAGAFLIVIGLVAFLLRKRAG